MGYLDGTSITVDAVLTKKGREILSDPSKGSLNVTSFTLTDTGVDYTLWNADHPSGSAYYGEAIENLPMLEASVHAEYALRNRLMTLSQNSVAMPALEFSGLDSKDSTVRTFNDADHAGKKVIVSVKGYSPTTNQGMYFVIQNTNVVDSTAKRQKTLSGITHYFVDEQNMNNATEFHVPGNGLDFEFTLRPDTTSKEESRETWVHCVLIETGTYHSFRVVNKIKDNLRAVMSTATKGTGV